MHQAGALEFDDILRKNLEMTVACARLLHPQFDLYAVRGSYFLGMLR